MITFFKTDNHKTSYKYNYICLCLYEYRQMCGEKVRKITGVIFIYLCIVSLVTKSTYYSHA